MNVTPLVDVVLVLLIIFMVVAPRLERDVPVNLPGVFNADPQNVAGSEPLKVTVAPTGELYVDGQPYDLDGAVVALQAHHQAAPSRRLALRADEGLPYGRMREVCGRIQKIGFSGVALMVGERHRPESDGPAGGSPGAGQHTKG
jgi:biopolymer transport protein ExbD/biopolymer transport protein TolR